MMSTKILNRLEILMKENKIKNLFQLSKLTGIGYTTMRNWYDKDTAPTLDMLIALSKYFECSIDYLAGISDDYGNIQYPEQKEELTPSERELLEMYRGLSPEGKGTAKTLVKSVKEYEVAQQRKNGVKMG